MSKHEIRKILASRLKEFRECNGLTITEVGNAVDRSEKTISAWEHERGQPDADMLYKLCALYKVDNINVFYGMEDPTDILTPDEQALINIFRTLNLNGQKLASETISAFAGNPAMKKNMEK